MEGQTTRAVIPIHQYVKTRYPRVSRLYPSPSGCERERCRQAVFVPSAAVSTLQKNTPRGVAGMSKPEPASRQTAGFTTDARIENSDDVRWQFQMLPPEASKKF